MCCEYAPLAQLDRVTGYEPVGQGFESLAACHEKRLAFASLFSMISVPCGTGDIADAMISASQMIYASRMKERILYHACEASISYGLPYIISRKRYIIENCYNL